LFNGTVSTYNENFTQVNNLKVTDEIVKTSCIAGSVVEYLVSGCINGSIIFSKIDSTSKSETPNNQTKRKNSLCNMVNFNTISDLAAGNDLGSVESLATNPVNSDIFVAGGSDKNLYFYKVDEKFNDFVNTKKSSKDNIKKFKPYDETPAHTDTITCLSWINHNHLLSGSLDHTLNILNTDRKVQIFNINFKDSAVTSNAFGPLSDLILSGHEDGNIRVFDEKSKSKVAVKLCKSHQKWISDLKFHPINQNIFASASYDGLVKIWDMRSDYPLSSVRYHKDKLFS